MARLTGGGALDKSFAGGKGYETLPSSASAFATSAALQTNGKLLVLTGGFFQAGIFGAGVYRFNANGSLDTSYGVKGLALVGSSNFAGPGGAIDRTFGTGGFTRDNRSENDAGVSTLAIAPNGMIYLAGSKDDRGLTASPTALSVTVGTCTVSGPDTATSVAPFGSMASAKR